MPTYEYACQACGHTFEQFQRMSDPPIKKCPKCGKRRVKRLIGRGGGLIFKGSGFYENDYKKAPAKKEGGESKPAVADSSKPAASTGESKPASSDNKPATKT